MNLPLLVPNRQSRVVTDRFTGYDHRMKIADSAFYDTENLSSRDFPLLSTRPRRGKLRRLSAPGGLIAKDALAVVDDGTLYYNGLATAVTGLRPGEKQLVSMGAYLLIFPDKVYFNTEDPADFGSMEADLTLTGDVAYSLCDLDGRDLDKPTVGDTEPAAPANAALWIDTAGGGKVLRQWSAVQSLWVEVPTVYTKLSLPSHGRVTKLFSQYDGVEISGAAFDDFNGDKILYALGGGESERDYIVLAGLLEEPATRGGTLRIRRSLPPMDFVCESQNRLWGCYYGSDGDKTVNEIYASALGDFKNFRQYLGLATDSWTASVGSDGQWTGAINYLGHPSFFKANRIHQVTVSPYGAHRLDETPCRGVQKGCHKSLCVLGESLYYKAPGQICVWQGGFPQSIGAPLGEQQFSDAVGGGVDGRYYLSMKDAAGAWQLFVYDSQRSLWYREDGFHALSFAENGGELYAIEADTGELWAMKGSEGEPEQSLSWRAETGILHYETTDRKYLSRLNLSLRMAEGARLKVSLRYDSEGDWQSQGEIVFPGTGTVTLPIRPRRCDHLQLRLEGEGEVRIYALTRVLEIGSDL